MEPDVPLQAIAPVVPVGAGHVAPDRWLAWARVGWLALAVATVGLFVAGIPAQLARLQRPCPAAACASGQLPPDALRALGELGLSPRFFAAYAVVLGVAFLAAYGGVAALIFRYGPPGRLTLATSLALLTFPATFGGATGALAEAHPAWAPAVAALDTLGSITFIIFLLIFPDGQFVPRWTRWVALAWAAQQVAAAVFPAAPFDVSDWPIPAQIATVGGLLGTAVYAQVYRYRRVSDGARRRQTRLVVVGIATALILYPAIVLALAFLLPTPATPTSMLLTLIGDGLVYAAMLLIPITIGAAMLQYQLFDVAPLFNRALVYGVLTASVLALYGLLVAAFGTLFASRGGALTAGLAAALAAVAAQPLRERLQRGANRLLYGQRDEPAAVLADLGQHLESALTPEAILPIAAETVVRALKLPHAAIAIATDDGFVPAASYGPPTGPPLVVPLVYGQETVGQLLLSPRPGDAWTPGDHRLLGALAGQLGVAVRAVRLRADLRRVRERLVLGREEERRRLRRDLHDGLGPQLASQTLTLAAATRLLRTDPGAAEQLLDAAIVHAEAAIADIRRVVYALRPPALDDLGLVGALREGAAQYHASGVRIAIDAPAALPPLPAAVEVAAYRIAQEAITNVVRHAGARECAVRLRVPGHPATSDALADARVTLLVEIADDGVGLPASYTPGVGLASMQERATELGGTCTIVAATAGGTLVRAELPLT